MIIQGLCSRADLLKCLLQNDEEALKQKALYFGYVYEPTPIQFKLPVIDLPEQEIHDVPKKIEHPEIPAVLSNRPTATFYRITACEKSDLLPEQSPETKEIPRPDWYQRTPDLNLDDVHPQDTSALNKQPLAVWAKMWPFLYRTLSATSATIRPDIPKLANKVAQGQWLKHIPKETHQHWASNVCILLDRNARLFPFNRDFTDLTTHLEKLRGSAGLESKRVALPSIPDFQAVPYHPLTQPKMAATHQCGY